MITKYRKLGDAFPELCEKTGHMVCVLDYEHPRLSEKIIFLWGSEDCMKELEALLGYTHTPERPTRSGFHTFKIIKELNTLLELHQEQFPEIKSEYSERKKNVWW